MNPLPLSIMPKAASAFTGGLSVSVSSGGNPPYQTVPAALQPDGTWLATPDVQPGTETSFNLIPTAGTESKPYGQLDTSRTFTPTAATAKLYAAEGIYGLCSRGPAQFAEPPPSRIALMEAAFGAPVADCGIFDAHELPHGATLLDGSVYFIVHAPHAVCATLILAAPGAAGALTRQQVPMSLTQDNYYWWCALPAAQAAPGAKYRFFFNDAMEVIDPGARAVFDGGSLFTTPGQDPNDNTTSWAQVLDYASVYNAAHAQPWQTLGWDNLLIYEMHAQRFSTLQQGAMTPFDLLVDELSPVSRLGRTGYLRALPVTEFELLPVTEFSSEDSWGYDPAFYFAIDSFYGGAPAMARFVNAAHAAGRGVMLDIVYNHSLTSSLAVIAPDVYCDGQYDGDKMNCGHPMMQEYFRQATIYLFRTFFLDGFRFDDTQTVVSTGGWGFLGNIRDSLRKAAAVEGRNWPYCVAENSATQPWDISNPSSGVTDGQWGIDESYRIRDACYDLAHPGWDESQNLAAEMNNPAYWGRPWYQAVRFGESHDMVSGQDPLSQRIAARPPWGFGYQMAKAMGALTLLSNGTPMLFMGQEIGETDNFSFPDFNEVINPQNCEFPPGGPTDQTRILAWFRQLMGLRDDPSKGLRGASNYQVVATGNRTIAYTCGANQCLFTVVTFGTPNTQQDSSWLGLPGGSAYKEIFNSSWPVFQVEFEQEQTNGGYDAQIYSGQILNLPYVGAVVLEQR